MLLMILIIVQGRLSVIIEKGLKIKNGLSIENGITSRGINPFAPEVTWLKIISSP